MQATVSEQRSLLALKDHDGTIGKYRYELAHLPIYATLADLEASLAQARAERTRLTTIIDTLQAEIEAEEASVGSLNEQIAPRQARYESGEGMDSRQLLTLESEIATLSAKRGEHEETQLELMDRLEQTEDTITQADAHLGDLENRLSEATAEKNSLEADLQAKISAEEARRAECAENISTPLLDAYTECRGLGGVGVVVMDADGTVDGGLDLSMIEIGEINALPVGEVYLTEDTGAIVIRAADIA